MQSERTTSTSRLCLLTLKIKDGQPWLAVPRTRDVFLAVLRTWHMQRQGRILAALAMPDHAHVLLELGDTTTAQQLVANWKAAMRRGAGYPETFERDFTGHRLRETENTEDYALYLYLQPYRTGLLKPDELWAGWWLPEAGAFRFSTELIGEGCPPAEWLAWPEEKFSGVTLGA